jgi:hypothetical protein
MPMLARGRHTSAEDGACLMEYVSVLAGESFTDHPICVDPLLVRLAWAVNDWAADPERARLVELAPRLIGTRNNNPVTAPIMLLACMECVTAVCELPANAFRSRRARAQKRLRKARQHPSGRRARWGDCRYREFHADEVIRECVRTMARVAPDSLPLLLEAGVASLDAASSASSHGPIGQNDGQAARIRPAG